MMYLKKALVASAAVLSMGSAFALPQFSVGVNSVNFVGYENQYRTNTLCGTLGGCLAPEVGELAGYSRVDPNSINAQAIAPTDLFIGIFKVTQLQPSNWGSAPTDNFTGYFVHEVDTVSGLFTNAVVSLKASSTDPFGKLAAGEMFSLYTDATTNFTPSGTVASTIAIATDGTKWSGLGLSGAETYGYTVVNLTIPATLTVAGGQINSYFGLDLMNNGAGTSYNAGTLSKVNDLSESLEGGSTTVGGLVCDATDLSSASVKCSDLVGNADIKRNANFASGISPWFFEVNDPLSLYVVPEPGALALAGLALVGVGISRRRKSM